MKDSLLYSLAVIEGSVATPSFPTSTPLRIIENELDSVMSISDVTKVTS